MDLNEFNDFMEESNARARRGRRLAGLTLAVAVIPLAIVAFLFIAAPNSMGGGNDPGPIQWIVPATGIVGIVIGLVWMVGIFRADPEPEAKFWRYRD